MSIFKKVLPKSSRVPSIFSNRVYSAERIEKVDERDLELDKLYRVLELELRGNDKAVLRSFSKFASATGNCFNLECKTWSPKLPTHNRLTVLKSVHVHKKHRVQYEFRTYYSFVQYKYLTGSTADTLLEYVQRNLPEGVAMKATKKIPDIRDWYRTGGIIYSSGAAPVTCDWLKFSNFQII